MNGRSEAQCHEDAVAIRGILDLFEESETITTREAAMTQHLTNKAALRLLKLIEKAGVIECPAVTRIILGVPQTAPCINWQLTKKARQGQIPGAEELVRGMTA
jgi:hypothetical protein